jgi:CIC family chloride channel protein
MVLLALAVGVLGAYAALGLMALIHWVQALALGVNGEPVHEHAAGLPWLTVLVAPIAGGLMVGLLVHWLVPERRNLGPADVMAATRDDTLPLDLKGGLASAAAAGIAIGSGASLGRYGPSVHLGAALASFLSRSFKLLRSERLTLVGCGVAAAISASFSAPLAGVLFAHEVVLESFARRGFVAITIAAVTGHAVARIHDVRFALAALQDHHVAFNHEFLLFAGVGALGGVVAIAFIKGLALSGTLASRIPIPDWTKPALAGALVGIVALQYPQVLGLGDDAIHDAIEQEFRAPLLLALLVAKLTVSCCCRGLGIPGGVFGPSLFLGAMLGSACGQLLQLYEPTLVSDLPVYALAGMGAVISCVIGAPITTVLIVFEVTGSYAVATAVMVAVVAASMVSGRAFPYSWFTLQLHQRGVDVHLGREVRIMRARTVRELVSEDFQHVNSDRPVAEVMSHMQEFQIPETLVVSPDGALVGQVSLVQVLAAVEAGNGQRQVGTIAVKPPVILRCEDDLDGAISRLRYFAGLSIPVLDSDVEDRVRGVVFLSSLTGAYGDAVAQARAEERGEA